MSRVAVIQRPPVFLDRDTVMAAIGEGTIGAAKGVRDFVVTDAYGQIQGQWGRPPPE